MIKDLKIPEFQNDPEFLLKTISSIDEYSKAKANQDVQAFKDLANKRIRNIDGVPVPLTKKESLIFNKNLIRIKAKIGRIKEKISSVEENLAEAIGKEDVGFSLDISKNKTFQTAARNIFGSDKKELSHEDYLRLVQLRKENSDEEKDSFINFGE